MEHYAAIDVSLEWSSVCIVDVARGMAQLMRMGWFRPLPVKAPVVQEIRARLSARKLLVAQLRDAESSLRGILRGSGRIQGGHGQPGASSRPASASSSPARPDWSGWSGRCSGPGRPWHRIREPARQGMKKAEVALARKLAVVMHRRKSGSGRSSRDGTTRPRWARPLHLIAISWRPGAGRRPS